jgi:2-polyprenyl-3-methyl-5-hydroxy-6-metoxy-1,4-benzoquinol methylase
MSTADRGLSLVCPVCRESLSSAEHGLRCPRCGTLYPETEGILHLTSGKIGQPGYDPHHFATLDEVEDRHFWFVCRRELIVEALRRSVPDLSRRRLFDIGCGTGGLASYLARAGIGLAGACDAYLAALRVARRRLDVPLVLVDEGRLPPLGVGQSLISMFDVLEHIDDDQATLRWLASVLMPGGALVLTVPAHPFLFGPMDRLACHRRRYRRRELRAKLLGAGLEVRLLTHFMAPLVPGLLLKRWAARWRRPPADDRDELTSDLRIVPGLNALLTRLLRSERYFLRAAPLPFGSSLLAVAVRPG